MSILGEPCPAGLKASIMAEEGETRASIETAPTTRETDTATETKRQPAKIQGTRAFEMNA